MKRIDTAKAQSWLLSVTASVLIGIALSCQPNSQPLNEDITAKGGRVDVNLPRQDAPRTDDYWVSGGTLHVKDNDAFMRVHKSLAKMSNDERLQFARTAGFKSLLSYQTEFVKACEAAESARDENAFKLAAANYADIVSLDASQTLMVNVRSSLLASYQDRTGVLYIGKALYRFSDSEQTIVLDGDRAKLDAPNRPSSSEVRTSQRLRKGEEQPQLSANTLMT